MAKFDFLEGLPLTDEERVVIYGEDSLSMSSGNKCKMLPVCMGPCSQKLLENEGKWSKEICSMGSIDSNLTDFLLMDFWVKSMIEKYNE